MEQVSFPRGGRQRPLKETKKEEDQSKTQKPRKKHKTNVTTDFLFGGSNENKDKKRKSRSLSPGSTSL